MGPADQRAAAVAFALRGVGLNALPDRRGRACVDVYLAGADLDDAAPHEIVAYFELEPLEALDDLGIAQEVLRQLSERHLKP
jgi:hypothetical protein